MDVDGAHPPVLAGHSDGSWQGQARGGDILSWAGSLHRRIHSLFSHLAFFRSPSAIVRISVRSLCISLQPYHSA